MTFDEFKDYVQEHLPEHLDGPADAQVQISEVCKTNDTKLHGVTIRSSEINVSPTVYLEHMYKDVTDKGMEVDEVLDHMATIFKEHSIDKSVNVAELLDGEKSKENIVFRIIGGEYNQGRMGDMPHRDLGEFTMEYAIEVPEGYMPGLGTGEASIAISNAIMEKLGMDEQTLYELAMENTPRIHEPVLQDMQTVLFSTLSNGEASQNLLDTERRTEKSEQTESVEDMLGIQLPEETMLVLTNEEKMRGASVLMYPGMLEKISQVLGDQDYVIIPSSIHETIIIPMDKALEREQSLEHVQQTFDRMVDEVNSSQVEPQEVLGSHAFAYDRKEGQILSMEEYVKVSRDREKSQDKGKDVSIADRLKSGKEKVAQADKQKADMPKEATKKQQQTLE